MAAVQPPGHVHSVFGNGPFVLLAPEDEAFVQAPSRSSTLCLQASQYRASLAALGTQFQIELRGPDGDDSQVAIDSYEVAVFQDFGRIANAIYAGDAEFPCDDRTVDRHYARRWGALLR